MLTVILFTFLSIGVSIINGETCACCFPWVAQQCQPVGFQISCNICNSDFCANHVKGCQGRPCQAICQSDSSSTTTTVKSSSSTTTPEETTFSMGQNITTTSNGGSLNRIKLFILCFSLTLLNFFFQLNN